MKDVACFDRLHLVEKNGKLEIFKIDEFSFRTAKEQLDRALCELDDVIGPMKESRYPDDVRDI